MEGLDDLLGNREHARRPLNDDNTLLSDLECDRLESPAVAGGLCLVYTEWLSRLRNDELDIEDHSADCNFIVDTLETMKGAKVEECAGVLLVVYMRTDVIQSLYWDDREAGNVYTESHLFVQTENGLFYL